MPEITASYHGTTVIGRNANERPGGDRAAPSDAISAKAPKFHAAVSVVRHEGERHPYACAEAQALAKILAGLEHRPAKLSEITFSVPASNYGYQLWVPCKNCAVWLEDAGGWGGQRRYRVKNDWDVVPVKAPVVIDWSKEPTPAEAARLQKAK